MSSQPISLRSILLLSSHLRLCLCSGLFLSVLSTKTQYADLISPSRDSFPNTPHLFISIALECNLRGAHWQPCPLSVCAISLLSHRYTLKDLPLTVDEHSNRTELYYIILSLVILIRLEVATTITRILDSPQALRFISMRNVQMTAQWVLGRLGWAYVSAKKLRHIGSYTEIIYFTTYKN